MIEDERVLGGILITVGDFMIDATVRLRLERLQRRARRDGLEGRERILDGRAELLLRGDRSSAPT